MSLDVSTNHSTNAAGASQSGYLGRIFRGKAKGLGSKLLLKRPELVDITDVLSSNAYHSLKDKGGRALTRHVRDVSAEARRRYGKILPTHEMDQLLIACDTHEITEIKDDDENIIWTRAALTAYRDPKTHFRLAPAIINRMVLSGRKPGQAYLNYIQELAGDPTLVRMKICDLTVNMSEERDEYKGVPSEGYLLKKEFIYAASLEYLLAVDNGTIDPQRMNIHTYLKAHENFRQLIPDYDAKLAKSWDPNWVTPIEPEPGWGAWVWKKATSYRARTAMSLGL